MRTLSGIFTTLSILLAGYCYGATSPDEEKPNVILINADDLGWADLECMGSTYYQTPNIDKLGEEGLLFRQAYAAASNCAPSRACMITGLYGPRHGVYTVGSSERGNAKTRRVIPVENKTTIPKAIYTLGEMFHDNGYVTASIGKWHISEDPRDYGFDVNVAGSHMGAPGGKGYFSPYHVKPLSDGAEGEYLTDRLTREAIAFIKENKDKPFFLYLPFYAVHKPLMAKQEVEEFYENKEPGEGQSNATYAAMIDTLDDNVGKLMDTLSSLGLEKDTIVVFTSDNGGIREVSHQDPLRAGKGSYYEGGIRIPLIIRWPGHVERGVTEQPVTQMDLFPTLQTLIGAQTKADLLDGVDIAPLLLGGETMDDRELYWHFPIYLQAYAPSEDQGRDPLFRTRPGSAIRSGDWKLVEYYEDGGVELYDLSSDPGEKNNLAKKEPEKVEELREKLVAWKKQIHAPVPDSLNPKYDENFERKMMMKYN